MGVCNQVTFLILNYITSRLVPLLKVTDAPIQVPNGLDLIVSFKFLNFSSQICFLSFLKCLLTSRLTLFRLSTLLWLGSCTHCILARFPSSKRPKHSSSNQGLFCLNSYKPRLTFADVWIFSLMFSNSYLRPRHHPSSPKLQTFYREGLPFRNTGLTKENQVCYKMCFTRLPISTAGIIPLQAVGQFSPYCYIQNCCSPTWLLQPIKKRIVFFPFLVKQK